MILRHTWVEGSFRNAGRIAQLFTIQVRYNAPV